MRQTSRSKLSFARRIGDAALRLCGHADEAGGSDKVGRWGERVAERMLKGKRFRILGKRVRLGPRDEIDLVARDGEALVFVEVKTRKHEAFGRPLSAVDRQKRRNLCRAAVRYLKKLDFTPLCFRFDVVEVIGEAGAESPVVRHTANVFPLSLRYTLPWRGTLSRSTSLTRRGGVKC